VIDQDRLSSLDAFAAAAAIRRGELSPVARFEETTLLSFAAASERLPLFGDPGS
jgi:hypothetical protein